MPATSYLGRSAWQLESDFLRASVLESGGHLAELILKSGAQVNPLWTQSRPTIDSDSYDPSIHGDLHGTAPESRLLSGLAGHNLCFPFWGNPSPAEVLAGMTFHGETNIRRWRLTRESPGILNLEVHLHESAAIFRRTIRAHAYALHVDCLAESTTSWDRPFAWCEHVTLGPPFLDYRTRFDASLTLGFITNDQTGATFVWPEGLSSSAAQRRFDLSRFATIPHQNLVNSFLVDPKREWGYFTAFNPRFELLFGYLFRRREFPWLNVWENNGDNLQTRGMEFSNTPHHGTMKMLIRSPERCGVPTYEWLDACSGVTKRFLAFLHPVCSDFRGTEDIRIAGDQLIICERGSDRKFRVPI